jgi:hypothetical protein
VRLKNLSPQTRYYYQIRANSKVLVGGDSEHYFDTSPSDADEPARIWILGDAGSSGKREQGEDEAQGDVRDAFLKRYSAHGLNFIMMLGDNAYNTGTDRQYQRGFFDPYHSVLRSKVSWPTQGNHDLSTEAYYNVYSVPTQGESGGTASSTSRYYSFDHGNIHLVSLNSEIRDASFRDDMIRWLRADLIANKKAWTVAFWHHPPHSKGHHDSDALKDSGGRMVWMREHIAPILEEAGVDFVFTGHSHSYERSKFLARYYGAASTFADTFVVQAGDGRDDNGRAYTKASLSKTPHSGTVYVTAGNAGGVQRAPLNHPAMVVSTATAGSVLLEVDANEARATMLGSDGNTWDSFTIRKDPTRPRAIKNLVGTIDSKRCEVVLTWEGGASDISYAIYRSPSETTRGREIGRVKGGALRFVDGNTTSSSGSLSYSVRAVNTHGFGPWGRAAVVSNLPTTCSEPRS